MIHPTTTEPSVGQIWADNDKRSIGRKIRIDAIEGDIAHCTVVADRDNPTRHKGRYNFARPAGWSPVGHKTRISVRRMRPTSNGYRPVADAMTAGEIH